MPNGGGHLRSGFFGEMEENGNKKKGKKEEREREKREMRWLRINKSRSHGRVCRASVC